MSMRPSDSVADESTQTLLADESIEPSLAGGSIKLSVTDERSQLPVVDGTTSAKLRVRSDINKLDIPFTCTITYPNGIDDPMMLEVTIRPDEGYYRNGKFVFSIDIPSRYPHIPPKVKCKTKIFHPNIDYQGNVYLNILREDWVPVLDINIVIIGLYNLLLEPNCEVSSNEEAAMVMFTDPTLFDALVQESIPTEHLAGCHFSNEEDSDDGFDMWRD